MKLKRPHKVGYRHPPRDSRFKPGVSGNPRGRPKKAPTLVEALDREADRTIRVQIGGVVHKMTRREVLARKLMQLAIDGQLQAARLVIELFAKHATRDDEQSSLPDFTIPDDDTIETIIDRLARRPRRS